MGMLDTKARSILFNTYWNAKGWNKIRTLSDADFDYAKNKGFMFDSKFCTHDEVMEWIKSAHKAIKLRDVINAFVASFSTRRLDYRSALGSFVFAQHFPIHMLKSSPNSVFPSGAVNCHLCGFTEPNNPVQLDLNVMNFERHKWGGVRHDQPVYAALDLELFNKLPPAEPTYEDWQIMNAIIDLCASLPSAATPNDLEKALSGVFKSNKAERCSVIEILNLAGVLQPKEHSGYLKTFRPENERAYTNHSKNDWGYPARWWCGADGVNAEAINYYFGSNVKC